MDKKQSSRWIQLGVDCWGIPEGSSNEAFFIFIIYDQPYL